MVNRKRLFLISIFVLVGLVAIGSIVSSGRYPASQVERRERAINWLSSNLELTDGQRSELLSISEKLDVLEMELKKDRKQIKDEIIRMLDSEKLDQDRIVAIIDEKKKQLYYFAPQIIAEFADFHNSLSIEQRRKLAAQIERRTQPPIGADRRVR